MAELPAPQPPPEASAPEPSADADTDGPGPVEPRVRYTLDAIEVRGNRRTRSRVVMRYVPFKPGDVIDVDDTEVELSRYRLLGTGFFRDVQFSLRKGSARGRVVLVIDVEERNTIIVNDLWMGLSADADKRGNARPLTAYAGLDVAETNLAGTGITFGAAVGLAQEQLALRVRFLDPAFLGGRWMTSATLLFNDAQDFFGNADVKWSDPSQLNQVPDYAVVRYQRFGGMLGVGRDLSVPTQLWMNLTLAALIPAAMLATRVAYGRPWGRLFSVTGRLRWGWLLQCMAVVAPLWVAYLAANWLVFGQEVLPRPEAWIGLLVVTLLTTPLQAAGEEVAFRGLVVQAVGAWIRSPVVALAVSTAVSAATFVAAHGSMDVWIWIDIGSLAVAACWLAWRTGGIEAGIALHVVNNLAVTFAGILLGGLEESYVDTETTGSPVSAAMSVVVMTIATALILWLARRRGIAPAGRTTPSVG